MTKKRGVKNSPGELLIRAMDLIRSEIRQLEKWVKETESGSWSTHQLGPMRKRISYLKSEMEKLSSGITNLFN